MKSIFRVTAITTALLLSACSDDALQITGTDAPILDPISVDGVTAAGRVSLLNYTMPGVDGRSRRENAVVMWPVGDAPAGGWPVIAWGHGTVGVADACAPSASGNLSGYSPYLNGFLQAGYAVVAPDYEGLGTAGPHPYLHLDSQGRSLTYAVAEAVAAGSDLSHRYAMVGHSQGGHAVLGGGSLAGENPGIELVGVVAIAPASQVAAQGVAGRLVVNNPQAPFASRAAAAVQGLSFSGLILHGTAAVSDGFDVSSAYGPDGAALQAQVETDCLPAIVQSLSASVPSVLGANGSVDSVIADTAVELPQVAAYLEALEPGSRAMVAPVLIAQGTADTTVLPASTTALVAQLSAVSATDVDPESRHYEGATHSSVLADSFVDTLGWLAQRFAAD